MDRKEDQLEWLTRFFYKKFATLADKSAKTTGISSMSKLSDDLHKIIIRKFNPSWTGVGLQ